VSPRGFVGSPAFLQLSTTYPANLCPLLFGGEFTKFGSDFREAIGQSIECVRSSGTGVRQRAPKHFHDMLSELECMKGAGQVGLETDGGRGGSGWRYEMPRLGASGAKLTLQVGLRELGVEKGHFGCRMTEQVHERWEADAGPEHLGSEGVAEHVGDDGPGNSKGGSDLGQFGAEFAQQRAAIPAASEQQPVGRNNAQKPEEAQTMDQLTDRIVDRHETLCVQLAQRYVECPLSGREQTQAVKGEIDTLADPDAGVADEQQRVAGDIVAAQEFLLDEAILFGSQRTGKPGRGLWDVVRVEQTDQSGPFVKPGQLLHQTA
jgi:hypothetical protein